MIILGIDPGTTLIGYGVVSFISGKFKTIAYGTIEEKADDRARLMLLVHQTLTKLIKVHKPDRMSLEKLFFAKNQKTIMAVSEMRGVLLFTAALANVPVVEFTPLQVKQYVAGYGGADKKQMQKIVRLLLNISIPIRPDDAADALALALCGATSR